LLKEFMGERVGPPPHRPRGVSFLSPGTGFYRANVEGGSHYSYWLHQLSSPFKVFDHGWGSFPTQASWCLSYLRKWFTAETLKGDPAIVNTGTDSTLAPWAGMHPALGEP